MPSKNIRKRFYQQNLKNNVPNNSQKNNKSTYNSLVFKCIRLVGKKITPAIRRSSSPIIAENNNQVKKPRWSTISEPAISVTKPLFNETASLLNSQTINQAYPVNHGSFNMNNQEFINGISPPSNVLLMNEMETMINNDVIDHQLLALTLESKESSTQMNILNQAYRKQMDRMYGASIKSDDLDCKHKKNWKIEIEVEEFDFDQELERWNSGGNNNLMYVLPYEAKRYEILVDEMNKQITDSDNIICSCRSFLQLWQKNHEQQGGHISRLNFFYQMFVFLFQHYIEIKTCDDHQPPCKPTVDFRRFKQIAVPILKQFCQSINPDRSTIIQKELLVAIESLIYIKPVYQLAVAEVFDLLFKSSIVEAVVFLEWSKLEDPSKHFRCETTIKTSTEMLSDIKKFKKSKSTERFNDSNMETFGHSSRNIIRSRSSNSSVEESNDDDDNAANKIQLITERDRLLMRLHKSGFTLLKKSNSIA